MFGHIICFNCTKSKREKNHNQCSTTFLFKMRRPLEPEVSNSAYRLFMGVSLERKNPLNLFPRLSNCSFNLITSSYSMLASPMLWLKIYHTTLISYMWPEVFSFSILFICCVCLVSPRLEKLRYCDKTALTQNQEKWKERLLLFALKDSSQRPLIYDRTASFWTNKNHGISGGFFLLFCSVLLPFFSRKLLPHTGGCCFTASVLDATLLLEETPSSDRPARSSVVCRAV